MMFKLVSALCFLIVPLQLKSQIFPKEGSLLNYRLIGFSYPEEHNIHTYKIEIAKGNYNRIDSFTKNIIQSVKSDSNKLIAEVPSFGSHYTWRVVYFGKKERASALYHFRTIMNDRVDTSKLHIRIIQPAKEYKDAYVSIDGGGVLYDMSGHPIWCIPDTNGLSGYIADMQFTPDATITFINKDAYEINYNGDILWKAPNKGVISGFPLRGELYHHEFTKLSNGHYLILGMKPLMFRPVYKKDTSYIIVSNDMSGREQNGYKLGKFGTLIEYNQSGDIVWSWISSDHLIGTDFDYFNPVDTAVRFDPHDNAFYFDERNDCIYLGLRNLSRIIKIEYPSGKILRTYGEIFKPGIHGAGEGLFCGQHSISRSQDGYLYVFNNNSCRSNDSLPTIVMLQEPLTPGDTFKKIWEYTCTVEGDYLKKFGSGGNVIELPDRSLFVNMSSEYNKLFIVNRDKKILWSALSERYVETDAKWLPNHNYRANIISRKDLERLIWSAENANPRLRP